MAKFSLSTEIQKIDAKTPNILGQLFSEIVAKINAMQDTLDSVSTSSGSADEFETDAITYGTTEPSD